MLDAWQLVAVGGAGLMAGGVNAVAGGGALITFPVLLAIGLPALTANVTNTVGQCSGYASIVVGYRPELAGQGQRIAALAIPAAIGAAAGVVLLKLSSPATFHATAAWLILIACGLLAAQPALRRRLATRAADGHRPSPVVVALVALASVYGAYFGAALGVLLLAALAVFVADRLQRLNALSRFVVLEVNIIAAVCFALLTPIRWEAAAVLAVTTPVGGRFGVSIARRLSDRVLRLLVIGLGLAASAYLFAS